MKTVRDFPPGTRVRFRCRGTNVSICPGLTLDLRAQTHLTGTALPTPPYMDMLAIQPDGWPLPTDDFQGFYVSVEDIEIYDGPSLPPAPYISPSWKTVNPKEAEELILAHRRKQCQPPHIKP